MGEEEQPAMNPRGIGGEKMDLASRKEKGVSSDTTECSLLLPPARRAAEWTKEGKRRQNRKGQKRGEEGLVENGTELICLCPP